MLYTVAFNTVVDVWLWIYENGPVKHYDYRVVETLELAFVQHGMLTVVDCTVLIIILPDRKKKVQEY